MPAMTRCPSMSRRASPASTGSGGFMGDSVSLMLSRIHGRSAMPTRSDRKSASPMRRSHRRAGSVMIDMRPSGVGQLVTACSRTRWTCASSSLCMPSR